MVQNLAAVVFLVLNRVERKINLSQKTKTLYELELEYLDNVIEGKVKEAEWINSLQADQVLNVVLWQIKLFKTGELAQARDFCDFILW